MDTDGINRVRAALDGLRDSQAKIEAAFQALAEQDLSKENSRLREDVARLNAQFQENRKETAALRQAHEELADSFKHELSAKRLMLLGLSERQHQAYLRAGLEREQARIAELYAGLQKTASVMSTELYALDTDEREPLQKELAALRERIGEQLKQARERKETAWQDAASRHTDALRELKNSPIEDAALARVRQFFAWEAFMGLKIISAAGALLILLGVFTFGRFLYLNMSRAFQCAAIFALGAALMAAGEAFYRKKWRGGFALALTASGSGILFLGAALGYMTLDVLPMWAALGICAGASLLTFAASLRYNAQLIAVFALIGGYLPLIALERSLVFFGAIYFTVLSLLALLIATRKNWRATRFIGLGAGLIAENALMGTYHLQLADAHVIAAAGASIAIGFAAYLVIPVFGAWFTKTRIQAADILLLSCNVSLRFFIGMDWGNLYMPEDLAWIAAFFAVCCVVMALVVERQKPSGVPESETGSLRALFFITSVTFSALTVLYALDTVWASVGLLIEATGLALYGIFKNRRRFNIAGLVLGAFCLLLFLSVNLSDYNNPLFVWQYLSVTLAAAVISAATAALKREPEKRGGRVSLDIFRAAAAFNLWGYLIYALHGPLAPAAWQWIGGRHADNFISLVSITLGFVFAFLLPRIRHIFNYGFQAAAVAAGVTSTIWLLSFNAGARGLAAGNPAVGAAVFALFIIVNITALGWINDFLLFLNGLRRLPLGWYPLLISGCAMLLAAQNLTVQLSLEMSSLVLTLLFGLTALGWVVFGFVKRNGVTRISGLSMAFFSVIKLFVLDLHGLATAWRIVSYFTAGIVLLAISFTYQWFSKRLETGHKKENTQ